MVFNQPYDVRLTEKNIIGFYFEIGNTLKHMHTESSAWIISGNPDAIKRVGLKPSSKFKLFNGPIESAYHRFDMYEGAKV